MFDDVESEVVKAAETPNGNYQQNSHAKSRLIEKQEPRCAKPHAQEKQPLKFYQARVGEVSHGRRIVGSQGFAFVAVSSS